MISSSGPHNRLSQNPGTANRTSVGFPAATADAIVEVCISGEGVADESTWAMSLTSAAVRLRLLGAGKPMGGVGPRVRTLKRGVSVFFTFGLSESTLIATPHSPGRSNETTAV